MSAGSRNTGVTADRLFLAMTRPAMALGVPYAALLVTGTATVEAFLLTRNLLCLLLCLPLHALFWFAALTEPRFLELWGLWLRHALRHALGNRLLWGVASLSPLRVHTGRGSPLPWIILP